MRHLDACLRLLSLLIRMRKDGFGYPLLPDGCTSALFTNSASLPPSCFLEFPST